MENEPGKMVNQDPKMARPTDEEEKQKLVDHEAPPAKKIKIEGDGGDMEGGLFVGQCDVESQKIEPQRDNFEAEDDDKKGVQEDDNKAQQPQQIYSGQERNDHKSYKALTDQTPKEISYNRKKKVALVISYCGAGYFGMQKNPGVVTIEDELLDALSKAGAIKEELKGDLGKMSFQRCARTDKGVSASRQVVSLKMVPYKELIPSINKHLPPSIRVFGMIRVTKGFDSKNQCNARTYQYLTPSFAFAPEEMLTVPSYRIKASEIERVNEILKLMHGTHNFHNFTSGKGANEASAQRYIMEFKAEQPFVKKGYEFIVLSVKGQSFMLHQIRKMIGLCIAICRGFCGEDVIERSWAKSKMDIPKAPGLGLILDVVHFDNYNKRYGSDGMHEIIAWEDNREEIEEFKNSFIWDTIIESEITQKSMMKWLGTLKNHTYSENRMPGNNYPERDIEQQQHEQQQQP